MIFKFIRLCLHKLSVLSGSEAIYKIYSLFPDSLVKAQSLQNIDDVNFQQLVVCPKCFATYTQDLRSENEAACCTFVPFPRHPQKQMRNKIGMHMDTIR